MTSTQSSTMHLTDDQIDEYLMGDLSVEATAHLDDCDPCLARVAEAEQPLASFRAVSLAWGERRSATLPLQEFASTQPRWTRRLAWGATAAVALAVGVAIPTLHHPAVSETNMAVAAVPATPVVPAVQVVQVLRTEQVSGTGRLFRTGQVSREEQIARDNKMLQAIDRELNASVESPAALGLAVESLSRGHNRSSLQD